MKKFYILTVIILTTIVNRVSAQIYLNGSASYQLNIEGEMGRTSSGCGDEDGLREINVIRSNGILQNVFSRRVVNDPFASTPLNYTKSNGIESIHVKKMITWSEWRTILWGLISIPSWECIGGPISRENSYRVINQCSNNSYYNQEDGLNRITISSKPIINIPLPSKPLYLTDTGYLTVTIPDNIDNKYFKWKYSVEGGTPGDIPYSYNYKSTLHIKGSDFLTKEDFGKNVSVWIDLKDVCSYCENPSPINFVYKKALPALINPNYSETITKCAGDKVDYKLQFDRALEQGEMINFSITGVGSTESPKPSSYANIKALKEGNTFTFKNLKAGTYSVTYKGRDSANSYSSHTEENPFVFTIKNPDPVKFFIIQPKKPSCNEGNDGEIYIGAYGGVHNYKIQINNSEWQDFTSPSGTHHIENLSSGKYTFRVKDANDCIGKDSKDKAKETITVELKAPDPITISYPTDRQKLPSFNGASDGYITAVIKGGTPLYFGEKKYNFVWENANGDILANTEYNFDSVTGEFSVILRNVREGNYFLSVNDQNYDSNNDKRKNCAKLRSQYYLSQPKKLKATIELKTLISCNSQNEFGNDRDRNLDGQRDESQNGELKIEASGGTPFTGTQNGGKPYIYTWKKQDNNGNWVTLPIQDDTAKNLSAGKYAINIQDANGIVLGEYNTHTVTKVVDVVYELKEPAKLTLTLQKTDATCKGNDGKITATPAGGTPPYTYLWSNGATTASIENLLPMPYTVEIKDGAGCMVQGSTAVLQPNSLTVTGTITPLRCHNATNAAIALAVQGGTAPYQYLWNTGATTANINNLPTGEYKVKITDAQGCAHFKTFTIENPSKFEIDLGENRTLCNGQTLTLNIAINDPQATYLWTGDNGFSSNMPQVTLSEKGTYRATVTTKDGCTATDAITIESANTQIASEFLLTTQAYENEEVILVNTSSPKGETTEWLVPENEAIEITNKNDDYISLIFKAKGEYRIGIKQTQGNCFELFYKNIIVEPATDLPKTQKTNEAFVREFEVAPNPNDGKFKAKVVLEKAGAIKFRLYSITGQLVSEKNSASATEHWVDFQDPLPAATYILVLETPYQRLSKKIIIIP